jgi:tetratricopeptide (TPR) repeat protein
MNPEFPADQRERGRGWWWWLLCVAVACGVCAGSGGGVFLVIACMQADLRRAADTTERCERAWQETHSEEAAVAGANYARLRRDDAALERWASRAKETIQGARIFHFWGERQRAVGDLDGAEDTLRHALKLRIDRDPLRATNTALALLELVRSYRPVEENIRLARIVWEQAGRANHPLGRAFANEALVDILLDLGEIKTADAVLQRMAATESRSLRLIAEGRLRAAQGNLELATALFQRARQTDPMDPGMSFPLSSRIPLVRVLLDAGRVDDARGALDEARELARRKDPSSVNSESQLAAAEAAVSAAEGKIDDALASVKRGLEIGSRDAARVQLLNLRGDALALRNDFDGAEQAWRDAADSLETWRTSLPSLQLRTGLMAYHRHALEAWLDSAASRGNLAGALEVTGRLVGRALLDRIRQREAAPDGIGATEGVTTIDSNATPTPNAARAADASIAEVLNKLAIDRDLAQTMPVVPDLRRVKHDMVAIMFGARWTWAIRRLHGSWSISPVGDRAVIRKRVKDYRSAPDDPAIAAALGEAMFPLDTLPTDGAPLVVLLDREISDLTLAGLRVGDRFLVEHAPILELLAPDLLSAPIPQRLWEKPVVIGDPLGDLPSAAAEAELVGQALEVQPWLARNATRASLALGRSARVLHVATHSTIRLSEAALVLFDNPLSSLEIVNYRIAPRVAVIATCRSQVDDDPATSLVAAFLAAGAAGVVGVKRALDDREGAELMRAFYAANGADDPLRALAKAQRAQIANHRPPHTWAAVSFFGVGGWIQTQE